MEFRNLGRSGLKVSLAGLGCNNFGGRLDLEGTRAVVHAALDHGITPARRLLLVNDRPTNVPVQQDRLVEGRPDG